MITDEDREILGAQPLTAWDRVKMIGIVALLPIAFIYQLVRFFLPSHPQRSLHWRQKAMLASIHAANVFQSQKRISYAGSHVKTTDELLRAFVRKRRDRIQHREVAVPISAAAATNPATGRAVPSPTLHFLSGPWLGSGDGPVLFYAHGGGYLEPVVPGAHIPLARSMAQACGARAIVFIAYALCPEAQYPAHLVQVVEAMRFLLEREAIPPGELVLAGDSAGAHMMASLLAHMAAPAPHVPPLTTRGGAPLRAVVLLSPWFTWTDAASLGGRTCDYLDGPHTARLVRVLRPRPDEVWCEIVAAPAAREVWARVFGGARPLVQRLLVTAAEEEIMQRDARVWAVEYAGAESVVVGQGAMDGELAVVRRARRVLAVGVGETHVQPGLDEAVGYLGGGTWRALQAFMSSLQD